ncbi:hypothetical protein AVEN_121145-1 [Araneus ventricosus]|uniref:Uncharacterized protein n=1 Tax=Araneus ventricosus TaxID=182803 RepID=A0A4Y2E1Z4_ARAVE|nr:hypothetical protein AVEN_121145-1 [Araneus ventricosus]
MIFRFEITKETEQKPFVFRVGFHSLRFAQVSPPSDRLKSRRFFLIFLPFLFSHKLISKRVRGVAEVSYARMKNSLVSVAYSMRIHEFAERNLKCIGTVTKQDNFRDFTRTAIEKAS